MKNCYPFNVELHLNAYSPSYDRSLLWTVFGLILFGVIMVTSASMGLNDDDPFYYTYREIVQLGLATACFVFMLYIPMSVVQRNANYFLLFTLILLIIVLFIGSSIKGASRWIPLGVFNFQPAELAKLALFCYLAGYLTRKADELKTFKTFVIPMFVMGILAILLLLQPDLGTVIVLFTVTLAILFIAGAKLWQFIAILLGGLIGVALLIIFEPYRMRRLTGFMDPWADPTGSGYQLTHSLMAIGNGGLWGEGLGNSVEKLGYLPEAHTDFIFAIIAEELGYIGVLFLLLLLFFLSFKAIAIGYRAISAEQKFSGYLACQIGVWFGFQTFVNVGVTSGLLPTKGLTLPFISYGGSSLIIMAIAVALLLRIDFEYRQQQLQAKVRRK